MFINCLDFGSFSFHLVLFDLLYCHSTSLPLCVRLLRQHFFRAPIQPENYHNNVALQLSRREIRRVKMSVRSVGNQMPAHFVRIEPPIGLFHLNCSVFVSLVVSQIADIQSAMNAIASKNASQASVFLIHSFYFRFGMRWHIARVKRLKIKEEGRIRLIWKPKRRKNVAMKWKKLEYQEEEKTHTTSQCKQIVMFTILFLFVWYLDGMVSFSSASRVLVSFVFCVIRRVSNKTARMLQRILFGVAARLLFSFRYTLF